ncbi:hypothetical protein [Amycolatopsis sp. NPDC021455]
MRRQVAVGGIAHPGQHAGGQGEYLDAVREYNGVRPAARRTS